MIIIHLNSDFQPIDYTFTLIKFATKTEILLFLTNIQLNFIRITSFLLHQVLQSKLGMLCYWRDNSAQDG